MKIIGITGGTGTGKTTVLRYLEDRGAHVIDCDVVYHDILENDIEILSELEAKFGDVVTDGKLDRKALGAKVFSDPEALKELNAITHKFVGREVDKWLSGIPEDGVAAIDAIALSESDLKDRCDVTIGVIAPTQVRVERLVAREGIDEEYAKMRIDAQRPNEYFTEHCDLIINNSGNDIDELLKKCKILFSDIFTKGQ